MSYYENTLRFFPLLPRGKRRPGQWTDKTRMKRRSRRERARMRVFRSKVLLPTRKQSREVAKLYQKTIVWADQQIALCLLGRSVTMPRPQTMAIEPT